MNGKFILVLFVCLNIATLIGSAACINTDSQLCGQMGENKVLALFVSEDTLNANPGDTGGIGFNNRFNDEISDATKEQAGGTTVADQVTNAFSFLDALKMILGVISLLTPFPLLAFFAVLGFPILVQLIFGLIPLILYVIAIIEFIGGRQL